MITVTNVSKSYGAKQVIKAVSFAIATQSRICIFAPSGAGKSTLIQILGGLDPHYAGRVENAAKNPGIIFQEPRLFGYKTVTENILYPLKFNGRRFSPDLEKDLQAWMQISGLQPFSDHYPHEISGGMKQTVSI
ncbi:ATP-binding cassette domain-containing protein, partial [Desulfobacterales bacterium HSG17]|nr:ATP-binding cassette domain-containing protein [Desulfobacterales bacterium HSG17]